MSTDKPQGDKSELLRQANFILSVVATEEFCGAWSHYKDNAQAWLKDYQAWLDGSSESAPIAFAGDELEVFCDVLDDLVMDIENEEIVSTNTYVHIRELRVRLKAMLASSEPPSQSRLPSDEWIEKMKTCEKITQAVFLACDEGPAEHIAQHMHWLIEQVEALTKTKVFPLTTEPDRASSSEYKRFHEVVAQKDKRIAELEAEVERLKFDAKYEHDERVDAAESLNEVYAKLAAAEKERDYWKGGFNGQAGRLGELEAEVERLKCD